MYQLEIKHWLVEYRFPPNAGWKVTVDIDAMERANGGQHKADKAEQTRIAEIALGALGVTIGTHKEVGRADVVAEHPTEGTYTVEVEGRSSRQREQAVYSALGQLMLQMMGARHQFVLAGPDEPTWERQILKIPAHARDLLGLTCFLVSAVGVREIYPTHELPNEVT